MIRKLFFSLFAGICILFSESTFALLSSNDYGFSGRSPKGTILTNTDMTVVGVLSLIQGILLRAVLPLIVVGSMLYIAYNLLTAEGDESKMKHAWKAVTFTSIALMTVGLSYAFVSILANISL